MSFPSRNIFTIPSALPRSVPERPEISLALGRQWPGRLECGAGGAGWTMAEPDTGAGGAGGGRGPGGFRDPGGLTLQLSAILAQVETPMMP